MPKIHKSGAAYIILCFFL